MIALLRTYLEIIALRKGPDVIPASWLVFGVSLALLASAWLLQLSLIDVREGSVAASLMAYAVALWLYCGVVFLLGFTHRLLPMLSTIIACGSIIAVLSAVCAVVLAPVTGVEVANLTALLVWFWSVPVKGHVIACTVNRHRLFGIAVAVLGFTLRFAVETSLMNGLRDTTL